MPTPLALCLEDLEPEGSARYTRCVALVGRQRGLRLTASGDILWQHEEDAAGELWVSADDRLILFRRPGGAAITLSRAGRTLDVPCEKPVVVIQGDVVRVGGRSYRIHVHGEAQAIGAPSPLPQRKRRSAAHLAAAFAFGAVVAGCGSQIEVREEPPEMVADPDPEPEPQPEPQPQAEPEPEPQEIEVIEAPPSIAVEPEPGDEQKR